MASCPNCGNHYDHNDPENRVLTEAGERQVIELVSFVAQELDESVMRMRCYACNSEWTASYKAGKLIEVHTYHPPKK